MSDCSNSVNKYIIVQPTAGETGTFSGLTVCGGDGITVDFITGCTTDGVQIENATFQGNTLTIPTIYATSFSGVTFSGGTFYGDGSNLTGISTIDSYMTGGTYSNGFITFSGSGNFSDVIVDVSGLLDDTNNYVTGATFTQATNTISLYRNGGTDGTNPVTVSFPTLGDTTIQGKLFISGDTTFNGVLQSDTNGIVVDDDLTVNNHLEVLGNISGTTFYGDGSQLTGIDNDYVTGGLYSASTQSLYFSGTTNFTPFTIDVSALLDDTNTYVTGGTLVNGNTLTLNYNNGGSASDIDLSGIKFTGNTSGDCITDLHVSNIHACSPLNINPFDEGNVYFGSTSGVTIEVVDGRVITNYFRILTQPTSNQSLTEILGRNVSTGNVEFVSASTFVYKSDFDSYSSNTKTVIDSKLNTSDFNTYSGSVQTQLDSKLNVSNFNTYSGSVQTQIDSKLGKSEFDSYSSTTQTTIDSKISFSDAESRFVNVTGDTMTGTLILPAGTTTDPSLILSDGGTLLTSPQIGAFEFLGTSLYFTDFNGSRRNILLAQSGFTATTVNALQDTEVSTVTNGQTWYYDGDTNFWRNTSILTINDTDNKVDINSNLNVGGVFGITGNTVEFYKSVDVYTGNVNISDNSYFLQGTSTINNNVSLIGVDNQDRVYIGNQGYNNWIADDTTIDGDLHISGDLTVAGSATTVNIISEEVLIADNFITLNSNVTGGTPTENAGIEISRGDETKSRVLWNETTDLWEMGISGSTKRVILEGDSLSLLTSGHTHPISDINGLQTELDSKLNISNFNTYSGNVQTQLDSKLGKTEFDSYSGNVQTQIDGKLNVTDFNSYSAYTNSILTAHTSDFNNPHQTSLSNLFGGSGHTHTLSEITDFSSYSGNVQTQLDTKIETVSNVGLGTGIFSGKSGTDLQFYSLSGGTNVGLTLNNDTIVIDSTDVYVIAGSYSPSTDTIGLLRNDGQFVNITGVTDNYITGGTLVGNTLVLDRTDSLSAVTIDLSSLDTTDNYTTGSTINGNTLIFNRTDALSAYTVDLTGLSNLPTDEEFQLFGNQSSTGIIYTDGLSVNGGDNSKFDLGLTQGWIVDNTTNPTNPTTTFINFTGETAISPTFLATFPVTYIGLTGDTLSDIVQSSSPFTYSHRRDILEIGAVIHTDNTIVNVVNNLPTMGIDPTAQLYDLIDGIGYFNIKDGYNLYSPYTGLTISKNGGDIFAHGSNYENDPKNPHVKTLSSGNTLTFRYRLQDSTEFSDTTQINPGIYDTGSGTGATPTNKYTVQRIYLFPSGISRLQYGQTLYDSLSDAQAAIPSETFNVEQNMLENGILRGFIVLRGDATDLTDPAYAKFVTANHFGDANDTVPGDPHRTEIVNHSSTGVRSGGQITINTDTTKFDISSGVGIIVDNFTTPDNPTQKDVRWNNITGITSTYVSDTGETHTYITIQGDGTIVQTPGSSSTTPQQKRDEILLGGILHINGQILFAWDRQIPVTSPMNNFEDLTTSIGPFSVNGNRISKITGTLSLEKSVGDSFYFGGFQVGSPKNPNIKTNNSLSASTLVYANGTGILGPSGTTIDTNNYDPNGLGVITPSTTNEFVAHRIWHQPTENVLIFQYGQYQYSNLAEARTNFPLESFVTPKVLLEEAYLVAVIITRDGETNLDNVARSQIIPQGKFAGTGGGGGTSDTLQTAYDNSTSPEIITDVTRGAVDFRAGSGLNSDNLVTFQQDSGTINGFVTGLGNAKFNSLSGDSLTILSTPTLNNSGTQILVRNTTTGLVNYRDVSSITPDTNTFVTGGTLSGNSVIIGRNDGQQPLTFSGGTNVTITEPISGTFKFDSPDTGEVNTASNVGVGQGVFSGKSGTDLQFYSLSGGSNTTLTLNNDTIVFDVTIPVDTNTFVTGFTYDGYNQHTISLNNGSGYTATISTIDTNLIDIVTVGEDVVSGDLLYLGTDARYYKADNTSESTSSTELRLSLGIINSGTTGDVLIQGTYTTTGLTSGSTYWVGTGGSVNDTQPTDNGTIVRYVGTALDVNTLEFNPDGLYIEISNQSQIDSPTNPSYRETTTSGSILTDDWTLNVTTTGDTTQTLPTAVGRQGKVYNIKNSDATSTSTVTLATNGTELIDGFFGNGTDLTFKYPQSITVQSTGSGWIII
jgi:cytoskeletal protein CcmA (bactofilin family)